MNFIKLFDAQRILDQRIELEHPREKGEYRLSKKILALLVELGELANEQRTWKFWSSDKKPRTLIHVPCKLCYGTGYDRYENGMYDYDVPCPDCYGKQVLVKNPLLEEYVDCLHFILSIGLEHKFESKLPRLLIEPLTFNTIEYQFIHLLRTDWEIYEEYHRGYYHEGLEVFLGLGEMLGFTWEQIEAAYYEKNEINHKRQDAGY